MVGGLSTVDFDDLKDILDHMLIIKLHFRKINY